ncbi:MAG: Na+/H+ antiporter subunit E [Pseudomonadota bacterium]
MNLFTVNMLLAVVWATLTATITLSSLLTGYVIGYAALWVASPLFGGSNGYFVRVFRVIRLIGYFLYELAASSIRVTWDVLTPTDRSNPKIVEVPLDVDSDTEVLLVTSLISLTPGTLSLDVSPDRKTLKVHAMFADNPDEVVHDIKTGMERMVKEVFQP